MYRGRFAPSPSGPLHFGSLVAAVAGFLEAKSHGGEWLLRIEDVDTPRVVPGAADNILKTLERFGLFWDGAVVYQSRHFDRYQMVLNDLYRQGLIYPCICSRKLIRRMARMGTCGTIYAGTCRETGYPLSTEIALRLRTVDKIVTFHDGIQGRFSQNLERDVGDFVLRRRDGIFAYHLAVVVDDIDQGITDIVRGVDLLDSTPRHLYLYELLQQPAPRYCHVPLVLNDKGDKLSKQTGAPAVDGDGRCLIRALEFLGQKPPDDLLHESVEKILEWGITYWRIEGIPSPCCTHDAKESE